MIRPSPSDKNRRGHRPAIFRSPAAARGLLFRSARQTPARPARPSFRMGRAPSQSPSAWRDRRLRRGRKFPARAAPRTDTVSESEPHKNCCALSPGWPSRTGQAARANARGYPRWSCPFPAKQTSLSAARGSPWCSRRASEFLSRLRPSLFCRSPGRSCRPAICAAPFLRRSGGTLYISRDSSFVAVS